MTGRHPGSVSNRPTTLTGVSAALAGAVAAFVAVWSGTGGGVLAAVGLLATLAGLVRGNRIAVDAGCGLLVLGVLASGFDGPVEPVLVGTLAAVVAWDLATSAIDLGVQLGREANTSRLELVCVFSSLLVGVTTVLVGYTVFLVAASGQPIDAVFFLLAAAVAAVLALEAGRGWRTRPDVDQ